jgi:AcrR family transcriptional regulator
MSERGHLPLRERKKQQTFQRIIDAADVLFRTVGYDQTTMEMIAEQAEVSRKTIFNYFPTKQALLLPFAHTLYQQRVQPEMRSYLETQPTTVQALRQFFMSIHEHVLTLPDLYRALREELFQYESSSTKEARTGFFEMLLAILQYGKRRGEVRSDIPLENIAHYLGAFYGSLLFPSQERQTEQEVLTHYREEIDTLLAFLDASLNPSAAQRKRKEDG